MKFGKVRAFPGSRWKTRLAVMNECPLEIRVNLEPGIRAVQMQNLNSFALKLDKILNRKWVFIDVLGGVL